MPAFAGMTRGSALARLEAAVRLVDDVGAAPAADHAAVAVARLEGLQGVADLHGLKRLPDLSSIVPEKRGAHLVSERPQVKHWRRALQPLSASLRSQARAW